MKRIFRIELILFAIVALLSVGAVNVHAGTKNYKQLFMKTVKTNNGIRAAIKTAKKQLIKLGYKKNATAVQIMSDANDQIKYANQVKAKYEKLAKEGKYKAAYLWAYQEFQYLVKAVVKLHVIQNLLTSQK